MRFDVEDEVDWSDGTIYPKSPPAIEPICEAPAIEEAAEEPYQLPRCEDEPHEQWNLPFGEPLPLGMPQHNMCGLELIFHRLCWRGHSSQVWPLPIPAI
jgi:hypothetical protein